MIEATYPTITYTAIPIGKRKQAATVYRILVGVGPIRMEKIFHTCIHAGQGVYCSCPSHCALKDQGDRV